MHVGNRQKGQGNTETLQARLKRNIFQTNRNLLLRSEEIQPFIIYVLLSIEFLQILWFSIHPSLPFLGQSTLLSYTRAILAFLNLDHFLLTNTQMLPTIIISCFLIVLLHLTIFILSFHYSCKEQDHRNKPLEELFNKLNCYSILLFNTVLNVPLTFAAVAALSCSPSSSYHGEQAVCSGVMHGVMIVLSVVILVVVVLEGQFYWFLYYTRNPLSRSYCALASGLPRLGKLSLKLFPTLYFAMGLEQKFLNIYCYFVVALFSAYIVFFRINCINNFNYTFFEIEFVFECLLLGFFVNCLVDFLNQEFSQNIFIHDCYSSALITISLFCLKKKLDSDFLMDNLHLSIKKQNVERWIFAQISEFHTKKNSKINNIHYISLLYERMPTAKQVNLSCNSDKPEEFAMVKKKFSLDLLEHFLRENPNPNLKLLRNRYLFETGHEILSIYHMNHLEAEKISIYDEYSIFEFKRNRKIFFNPEKNEVVIKDVIKSYLDFTENLNKMEQQIEMCTLNNLHFWEELCEENPSNYKIYRLAHDNEKHNQEISKYYRNIQRIFPHNQYSLMLFFSFLREVGIHNEESERVREKVIDRMSSIKVKTESNIENQAESRLEFSDNDNICVVQISTNQSSLGIILNCNMEVRNTLGYEKKELMGCNVSKIMPSIYHNLHDGFVRQYLEDIKDFKAPSTKLVLGMKKNQLLEEMILIVKIFPNSESGFQLVGFFKKKDIKQSSSRILVNMKSMRVEGINQEFYLLLGKHLNLAKLAKEPLNLCQLFPQLEMQSYRNGVEIVTHLRLTDCTDRIIDGEDVELSQGRGKNVIITVIQVKQFGDVRIGVLTVEEKNDNCSLLNITEKMMVNEIIEAASKKCLGYPGTKRKAARIKNKQEQKSHSEMKLENSINRRVENYIKNNNYSLQFFAMSLCLKIILLLFVVLEIGLNAYFESQRLEIVDMIEEINYAANVMTFEPKIAFLNQLMFTSAQMNESQQWQSYKQMFIDSVDGLEQNLVELMERASHRADFDLVINQHKLYDFDMPYMFQRSAQISYSDIITQLLYHCKNEVRNVEVSDFQIPYPFYIETTKLFIMQNLEGMLPFLALQTLQHYSSFTQQFLKKYLFKEMYFIIAKIFFLLFIILAVALALRKMSTMHSDMVMVFNSFKKWDAYELSIKCKKFYSATFENDKNHRKLKFKESELLKNLPKEDFVRILENEKKKAGSVSHDEDSKSLLASKDSHSSDYIRIRDKQNFKYYYCSNAVLIVMVIVIKVLFFFLVYMKREVIEAEENKLANIGKFQQSFLYTFHYGLKYEDREAKYRQNLHEFYVMSGAVFKDLEDSSKNMRQIYAHIELLNSINFHKIPHLTQEQKSQYLKQIETALLSRSENAFKIRNQICSDFQNKFLPEINTLKTVYLILAILIYLGAECTIDQMGIKSQRERLRKSANMLNMAPYWVLNKSRAALERVLREKIVRPAENSRTSEEQ